MKDYDLIVSNALKSNSDVVSLLGDGAFGIYHNFCDFKGKFPVVIYKRLSKYPSLNGDNRLYSYAVRYSVAIVSKEPDVTELESAITEAMQDAGFAWAMTDTGYDPLYSEHYTVMQFADGEAV